MTERPRIVARPWTRAGAPDRVLAIRLQAMGDVVITLPYLTALGKKFPEMEVDLLTREETAEIPKSVKTFSRVFAIGGGRHFKKQCLSTVALLPRLLGRRYDVVIDLQNSEISRFVVSLTRPRAWSRFDSASPLPAGECTRATIAASGLGPVGLDTGVELSSDGRAGALLEQAGYQSGHELVVLNPAGAFASRHWPLDRYVAFAREWQRLEPAPTRFLLLGTDVMKPKAAYLRAELDGAVLDLVGRTSAAEAFALVRRACLVLSEDSGLMHMAWVSGVPTLALFGSSRERSRPLGPAAICLHSGDLECGFCMEAECRFGDVHCLTRYDARDVAKRAVSLVSTQKEPRS